MSNAKCPNCDANLPASEIAGGWCETCGKRLPGTVAVASGRAPRSESRAGRKRSGAKRITFGGVVVLTACVTIGAVVGSLAMKGSIGVSIGCGVGGGVGVALGRLLGLWPDPPPD